MAIQVITMPWNGRSRCRGTGDHDAPIWPITMPWRVHDPVRARTVLFGGTHDDQWISETWEWDGETWHQLAAAGCPPAGTFASTYEPHQGKVTAFDGQALWTFDGQAWSSSPAPVAAEHRSRTGSLAFDIERGRLMYLDPGVWRGRPVALFEWDGSEWKQRQAPGEPPNQARLFYRTARQRLAVLDNGHLWEFDGSTWIKSDSKSRPAKISRPAVAFDPLRGTTLAFGNRSTSNKTLLPSQTWVWDGYTWEHKELAISPAPRTTHAMAYDPRHRNTVMFGGQDSVANAALGDTWLWDGLSWQAATPANSPAARPGAAMTYDSAHGHVLMFGGGYYAEGYRRDLWKWDGNDWTQLADGGPPAPRGEAGLLYDPLRRGVILVGGDGDISLYLNQPTWLWNGAGWSRLEMQGGLSFRMAFGMTYDAARREILAIGGAFDDNVHTWTLPAVPPTDPNRPWSPLPVPFSRDPDVGGQGVAYDPLRGRTLALASSNDTPTWELSYRAEGELYEVCQYGFDVDGDGLIGCADPDCWGYCTPMCPPGAECDESFPHCGDGECNTALETCRLCPEDCACEALCGDFFCDAGESAESCPGDCARPVSATRSPAP